jgi:sec-independent protein translocase protein TatA
MLPVPLFPGLPGGPELLVVFLVILLVFGPLVLGVVALFAYLRRRDADGGDASDRLAELEARVTELEREERGAGGDGSDAGTAGSGGRDER